MDRVKRLRKMAALAATRNPITHAALGRSECRGGEEEVGEDGSREHRK